MGPVPDRVSVPASSILQDIFSPQVPLPAVAAHEVAGKWVQSIARINTTAHNLFIIDLLSVIAVSHAQAFSAVSM